MIKSFHSLPPEPSHTYLALDQELDGIIIRAVDRNGHDIESGILMKITEEGIQLHQALSAAVQVKTDYDGQVRVFCHRYDELMTYREWARRTKEK